MAATFAAPLASVLVAVELLLFEWKPRSFVPVAIASATAAAARRYLLGLGPLFPVHAHPLFIGPSGLAGCVAAGLGAGVLSMLMTMAVYGAEDAFQKHMPIHWMWCPALGGLAIGIGGLLFPQALGGVEGAFLPNVGPGFWPLVSMGAILGGTMRSPLTGIVFAIELTHDLNMLLPLLIAVTIAHAFTVLTMRRSILTEKVSRRGYHLTREYSIDPLEILFVREVIRTSIVALSASMTLEEARTVVGGDPRPRRRQRLYPASTATSGCSASSPGGTSNTRYKQPPARCG